MLLCSKVMKNTVPTPEPPSSPRLLEPRRSQEGGWPAPCCPYLGPGILSTGLWAKQEGWELRR